MRLGQDLLGQLLERSRRFDTQVVAGFASLAPNDEFRTWPLAVHLDDRFPGTPRRYASYCWLERQAWPTSGWVGGESVPEYGARL